MRIVSSSANKSIENKLKIKEQNVR